MITENVKYIPITTDDLRVNTILDFDIFIRTSKNIVLFRKGNLPFTEETVNNLAEHKVRTIFISEDDKGKFEEYYHSLQDNSNSGVSMEGCAPPFDNPENVEIYYKSYFNYYPIEKTILQPGSKVDFNVYKKLDIDVKLYFGPHNENDLSGIVPEDVQSSPFPIVIHNDEIPLYKEYIKNIAVEYAKKDEYPQESQYSIIRENSKFIIKDILSDPRSGEVIQKAGKLVETLTCSILDNQTNFYNLLKITTHDYYTYTHSLNVCSLSIGLGVNLNLKMSPDLIELGLGALLHDIGKCTIEQRILNKPGRLTEDEYKNVKHHVIGSKELLKDINRQIPENSLYTILQHHEKLSGNGYPYKLKGEQVHLYGRIGAIVDFYDALTTERSYKKAYTPFEAFQLLSEVKEDYDQQLVKKFIVMLGNQGN
jgi:HD-GYP domain-containing protein (c-di-GMP phosphodiesterase class II)